MPNILYRIWRKAAVKLKLIDIEKLRIREWREAGIKIGESCHIYSPLPMTRDRFLLEIGNNVTVSGNVTFLMHDNAIIKPTNGNFTDLLGGGNNR